MINDYEYFEDVVTFDTTYKTNKDYRSLGMRTTQLSESFNVALKNHLKSDLHLVQFFTHFERVVNGKKNNESEVEYESINKLTRLKMVKAAMLVQTSKIYTPIIFEEFQEEYEEYQGTCIKELKQGLYIVTIMRNLVDQKVACDYCKLETHGILCSHALKVFDVMNVKIIPQHYILKRWTREARVGMNQDWKAQHIELDIKANFMNRYNILCPRVLYTKKISCVSHFKKESHEIIEEMLAKNSMDVESIANCHVSISITNSKIQNNMNAIAIDPVGPKVIKKRECLHKDRKRPQSWVEKMARMRKGNQLLRLRKCQTKIGSVEIVKNFSHWE
ncbi:hypothetical protein Lal_00035259, partial [Lupinus albus]